MAELTRDDILDASDITTERVNVPEWGEGAYVYIRVLSGADRDNIEREVDKPNKRAYIAMKSVCNERGELLFTMSDLQGLGRKNGVALERIVDAVLKLNKIDSDSIEETEKNSEADPSDSTGSE